MPCGSFHGKSIRGIPGTLGVRMTSGNLIASIGGTSLEGLSMRSGLKLRPAVAAKLLSFLPMQTCQKVLAPSTI